MCDFWARVKLRKKSLDVLVQDALESIKFCEGQSPKVLDDVIKEYWNHFGVKNVSRLCEEEPDLYDKMKLVEQQVRSRLI